MGETNFDRVIKLKERLQEQDNRENNDLASFIISNNILRGQVSLTAEEKGLFVLLSRYATAITDTKKVATYQVTITLKQIASLLLKDDTKSKTRYNLTQKLKLLVNRLQRKHVLMLSSEVKGAVNAYFTIDKSSYTAINRVSLDRVVRVTKSNSNSNSTLKQLALYATIVSSLNNAEMNSSYHIYTFGLHRLAKLTGISYDTVRRYLKVMKDASILYVKTYNVYSDKDSYKKQTVITLHRYRGLGAWAYFDGVDTNYKINDIDEVAKARVAIKEYQSRHYSSYNAWYEMLENLMHAFKAERERKGQQEQQQTKSASHIVNARDIPNEHINLFGDGEVESELPIGKSANNVVEDKDMPMTHVAGFGDDDDDDAEAILNGIPTAS